MADEQTASLVLNIQSAETSVAGASATVALPATVWHLLGATGAGRVYIQGAGAELPRHRLAVLLGRVSTDGSIEQHQTDTLFLVRPTEEAETEDVPPFCGHPGNAEYSDESDSQPGGGGGGGQDEEDDANESDDTMAVTVDGHPGDEPGAVTPISSEDCETPDEGDNGETDQ